jgi:hypothetical protein
MFEARGLMTIRYVPATGSVAGMLVLLVPTNCGPVRVEPSGFNIETSLCPIVMPLSASVTA